MKEQEVSVCVKVRRRRKGNNRRRRKVKKRKYGTSEGRGVGKVKEVESYSQRSNEIGMTM